jgi:PAS domain S-box-containing protein
MNPETPRQDALHSALFSAPIGMAMAITDLQGRILECNQAYCAMLGYTRAELQTLETVAITHPDDRARNRELLDQLVRREVPNFVMEKRYLTKAGETIWSRIHVAFTADDSDLPGCLLGVAEDITAQRLANQQLQRNQLLLRMAGRAARLGGWTYDCATQALYWSEEIREMHGHPPGYRPTLSEGIAHYAPEYHALVEHHVGRCLAEGTHFDFEAELVRASGERLWVRAIGEAIRDQSGAVTGLQGAFQDITVQREHERERHALATKLTATLEHMSDAFFTLDHAWNITYANEEMSRAVKRSQAEMVGRSIWEVFPGVENSPFHACYQRAIDTRARATVVEYYAPLDQWFEVHAHPTEDGVAVHFQDITQKRHDEARLHLLQNCVQRMNDIIVITEAEPITGPGPKVIYVNEAFEKHTGYSAEEIIGQTPRLLQGPKSSREVLDRIRTRLQHWQPVREEILNYTKDGRELWLELDIVPVSDANGWYTHWIAIERNITERKRAAEAMSEQAELLDKAQDAIWVMDLQARITFWNRSAESIHGWPAREVLGTDARALLYQDSKAFEACLQAVMNTGEWVGEVEHKTREGKKLLLVSRLTLVKTEAGEPRAILAINTDVTEQKLLEQQFLRAQRMESIGTLAGGIAHDLNNVLAPILMSIQLLKEAVAEPEDQALLRTIEVSARRGADLIRQVLSFARGVEGRRHEVRLPDVLKDLENILNETIPRNIAIQSVLADGLWRIQADPTQLQQVLLNLCVNARDAMPAGGRIRISAENIQLDEHYAAMNIDARVGPYVKLEVEDNGSGIDPSILDRVFDPFFTTKPVGAGTGLGLATTQAIVKGHGGFIRVYSEHAKGTRFRIYLPADPAAASPNTSDLPTPVPRGQNQLVLVVDDEQAIRQVTRQTLEAYGYRVLVAANGAEAVALYAQNMDRVDLVLTDMMMPVMDGPATIQALRQIRPGVRIVGASGISQNGQVARAAGAGVRHFLPKPYTADVLLRTLAEALTDQDPSVE